MKLRLRLVGLLVGCLALPFAVSGEQPNVVVFLADDAGWGDFSHSGNQHLRTPRIDSIAEEGASLDRFFVCPVCSPTRAEFLTGRYHPRTGVAGVSVGRERLNLDEHTVADAFHAAGYATGAFGKWHNGSQWPYHPMARGFDVYFGHTSGHWGEYIDPPLEDNGRMVRTKGYIADVCTERALDFIDRHHEGPFFCYVPFTTPHTPWSAPEADWERFRKMPLKQTATDPSQEVAENTRCALAMVENQDMNVGRVLDRLKEFGVEENTIVVYFSDNGPNSHRWNGGMKGRKASTDEGGVRSVCYLRWPAKIPAGRVVEPISGAIDLLPTLTSLARVDRVGDKPLDGRDLTPLLLGRDAEWPDRQIFSAWRTRVSVRTETHRLDTRGALFDLRTDPSQSRSINNQEPALASELQDAVGAWRREMYGPSGRAPTYGADNDAVDPRPIPVGYREFPITMLPARDGLPQGGVCRSTNAPNCSYFIDWSRPEDRLVWNVEVQTAGRYRIEIDYTCKLADVGSTVAMEFLGASVTGKVAPAWDPPLYTNQDTLPRPEAESQMKEFRSLRLGEVRLPAGVGPLSLRATDIPGDSVMDLRRVTLTLLPE